MFEKLKILVDELNKKGINLPMISDPKTGQGSVTLTMFIVSFTIAALALIGKVSNITGQFNYSDVMWLYGLSGSFYLGRKISGSGKNMEVSAVEPKKDLDSAQ